MKKNLTFFAFFLILLIAKAGFGSSATETSSPKNTIVMIADGAGFNHFLFNSYYNGSYGNEVYDSSRQVGDDTYDWINLGCTNFPDQGSFDPEKYDFSSPNWSYIYPDRDATDSAASATAWNTGVKTTAGRINYGPEGNRLKSIGQYYSELGRSVGSVTSVSAPHATPAAVWTHNLSRGNYTQIFAEMANSPADSGLDVVIGAGHPFYDNHGTLYSSPRYRYIDQATWEAVSDPAEKFNDWTFCDNKEVFQGIADGSITPPERLMGIAPIGDAFRSPDIVPTLPSLAECAQAALNVLDQNENGFLVQIECGEIDFACHRNNVSGLLEGMASFMESVDAVVDWVETNSSWEETLLIVTADHETGKLRSSNRINYWVEDLGPGNVPGHTFNSSDHTNDIVPFYAIGSGSSRFGDQVDGYDTLRGLNFIDNTDIFSLLYESLPVVPEPGSVTLFLMLGTFGLHCWIRRTKKSSSRF